MSEVAVPRDNLTLQHFLALFLFGGAGFFGIATLASAGIALSGDLRAVCMLIGTGLPTWMLVWLGTVLWSGRGIPRWFIASFLLFIGFGPFVLALFCDTWMESLALISMAIPTAISILSTLRNFSVSPAKPKTLEEL